MAGTAEWSEQEHHIFLSLLPIFGKDFARIVKALPSKKLADVVAHYYYMKKKWGDSKLPRRREHASSSADQCSFCLGIFPDESSNFVTCAGKPRNLAHCQEKICSNCASLGIWSVSYGSGSEKLDSVTKMSNPEQNSLDNFIKMGEKLVPFTPSSASHSAESSTSSASSSTDQAVLQATRSLVSSQTGCKTFMCPSCAEIRIHPPLNEQDAVVIDDLTPTQAEVTARLRSLSSFLKLSQRRWLCDRCTFCNSPSDSCCMICHSGRTTRNLLTYALARNLYSREPESNRSAFTKAEMPRAKKRKKSASFTSSVSKKKKTNSDSKGADEAASFLLQQNRRMLQEATDLLKSIKHLFIDEPMKYHTVLDALVKHAHGRAPTGEVVQTISKTLENNPSILKRFYALMQFDLGSSL